MTTKKLTLMAILAASALIIFIIEAQIPLPIPVPGVKLGLANAITLFALFYNKSPTTKPQKTTDAASTAADVVNNASIENDTVGAVSGEAGTESNTGEKAITSANAATLTSANAFTILMCRIVLGAIFTGRFIAFIYSVTGGILGFTAQVITKRFVSSNQIWVCSAIGAVFHNIGQIIAAVLITGTPAIAAYLPLLIIAGLLTGALTGLIAQITIKRISHKL